MRSVSASRVHAMARWCFAPVRAPCQGALKRLRARLDCGAYGAGARSAESRSSAAVRPARHSPTWLARAGVADALFFTRGKRPPIIIGESLVPAVIPFLRDLGVEDEVAKYSMYKPGATFVFHPTAQISFRFAEARGARTPYSYNVPRDRFDATLLDSGAARGRGAHRALGAASSASPTATGSASTPETQALGRAGAGRCARLHRRRHRAARARSRACSTCPTRRGPAQGHGAPRALHGRRAGACPATCTPSGWSAAGAGAFRCRAASRSAS